MAEQTKELNLKVKVPVSQFKVDDVVKTKNSKNDEYMIISITKIFYMGRFMFCPTCGKEYGYVNEIAYETVIQKGSISDGCYEDKFVLERPGKVYRHSDSEMIDAHVIDDPDFEIIEADNEFNIKQREIDWRSNISKLHKQRG